MSVDTFQTAYEAAKKARQEMPKIVTESDNIESDLVKTISGAVCGFLETSMEIIRTKSKERTIVVPRQVMTYFMHKHTRLSLRSIARYVNAKDHTSTINGVKTVCNRMDTEEVFRIEMEEINRVIQQEINKLNTL